MMYWLLVLLACGGGDEKTSPKQTAPKATTAPISPRGSSTAADKAREEAEEGWGAVFWRNDQPWKVGGSDIVASPATSAQVIPSGDPLACGGVAIKGAPKRSALALPAGSPIPKIKKAPAIQAHLVERAAWRLDEVLPPRGKYTSAQTSKQPAQQRGVKVGSVAKTRRYGSPPILIATGVRDCVGSIGLLTASADRTLAYDLVTGACEPLRVVPATDMNGNGSREFAVFNDTQVHLYRLGSKPGRLDLTRIASWTCEQE